MGEVYQADETKLERQVALKVLPAELADDPDRLSRLQREARAMAALEAGYAFNFAAAGKTPEALDCLELDFEEHNPNVPYIGV